MGAEHVVSVDQATTIARQIAVISSVVLIQSSGDPANAIARVEEMRGLVNVNADNGEGFEMDVAQVAQEAINEAAEIIEADDREDR